MPSTITIKEISHISGYSISTVSKALNDRYEIKESTKEKIRKIARSKNYVPNNAARALRNKRTKIIGVIVPKITNEYFNHFLCQIQKKASKESYHIMISQSYDEFQKEKEAIIQMHDGMVDAVLILSNSKFSNGDFNKDLLKNVVIVPFQNPEEYNIMRIKELALSSFKAVVTLINKNYTSMY